MNDFTPFTPDEIQQAEKTFNRTKSYIDETLNDLKDRCDKVDMNSVQNREWAMVVIDDIANSLDQLALHHKVISAGGYTIDDEQKKEDLLLRQEHLVGNMREVVSHMPDHSPNWAEKIASELSPARFLG